MPKYCAPSVETTALNQGRLTSDLYSLGWSGWGKLVATTSGAKWKEQSGRRNETQGLADTGLGRRACQERLTVASPAAAGGRRGARFSRPSLAQQSRAGDGTGWPLTHLVGDLKWKQKTQFREQCCFGARCPSSFQTRPYLGLSIQLRLTGLLHSTVQGSHHPLWGTLPGATNTSASSSRPSRPGPRRVRGGADRNIFVLFSLVSIRHQFYGA